MKLIIHPEHPGALAVDGSDDGPQFVTAERVLEYVRDLERQLEEGARRYDQLFAACENLSAQRNELRKTGAHTHAWVKRNAYRDGSAVWVCADCGANMQTEAT